MAYLFPSPAARHWLYQSESCESPLGTSTPPTSLNVFAHGGSASPAVSTPPSQRSFGWAELSDVLFPNNKGNQASTDADRLQKKMGHADWTSPMDSKISAHLALPRAGTTPKPTLLSPNALMHQSYTCPAKQRRPTSVPDDSYIDMQLLEGLIKAGSPPDAAPKENSAQLSSNNRPHQHPCLSPPYRTPPRSHLCSEKPMTMPAGNLLVTPSHTILLNLLPRKEGDDIDRIHTGILRNMNYEPEYDDCVVPESVGSVKVVRVPSLALTLKRDLQEPFFFGPPTLNGADLLKPTLTDTNDHSTATTTAETIPFLPDESLVEAAILSRDGSVSPNGKENGWAENEMMESGIQTTNDTGVQTSDLALSPPSHFQLGNEADSQLNEVQTRPPSFPYSSFTLPANPTSPHSAPRKRPTSGPTTLPPTSTYPNLNTPTVPTSVNDRLPVLDSLNHNPITPWSAPQHAYDHITSPSFGKLSFAVGPECAFRDHLSQAYLAKKASFSFSGHNTIPYDNNYNILHGYQQADPPQQTNGKDEDNDDIAPMCGCAPTGSILKSFGRKLLRRNSSKASKQRRTVERFGNPQRPEPSSQDDFLEYPMSPSPLV